ncbi:MAG: hypothetical protein IH946_11605, partial [Bacteroidetes bacterium]|nr:hypothetical protein [Bacteroidota bacterium]
MFRWLLNPYPLNLNLHYRLFILGGATAFIILFYGLFQPFHMTHYEGLIKLKVILGFGSLTAIVLGLNLFTAPVLFPGLFREENWKTYKEGGWILWNIATVSLALFMFKLTSGFYELTLLNLLNAMGAMLAVGGLATLLYLLVSYIIFLKL